MKKILLILPLSLLFVLMLLPRSANALSGSDFNPARIIDDSVFFNGESISASDIQLFLNSKVPVCDSNHASSNPQYQPPFTCLKDFRQDTPSKAAEPGLCNAYTGANRSAAEIIYEVGKSCGVSQKAILVLLQKEQSLVTDTWPWSLQYRSATGYGCPDTAPCDAEYYGFFNQVYNAARQFKKYGRDESLFRYRAFRENYIQYNPNANCGGSNVFIQNQATAGLYNYTPYQPNASALANLYGSGDSCGAYGNRNFWRMYNDWFGPPTNNDNYWVLVKHPTDGRYFIATNFAVHYVPNSQTLVDWGLNNIQPVTVTTEFITSRTYGSPVNRLLRDKFGNIFLMDSGKRHYVQDNRYLDLWQQDVNSSITVHGLVSSLPEGEWLRQCARSASTPTNSWVINSVNKYSLSSATAEAWGCNASTTTTLSDNYLSTISTAGTASNFAANGSTKFLVDQGQLWSNSDSSITDFYKPSGSSYLYIDNRLKQFLGSKTLTIFAEHPTTKTWYLIDNNTRHAISSIQLADLWGYQNSGGLTKLSANILDSVVTSGNPLSPVGRMSSPDRYYLVGGDRKHYIPNQTAIDEWLKPGTSIEPISNELMNRFSDGQPLTSAVGKTNNGSYSLLQSGKRQALWNSNLVDAWGGSSYIPISTTLMNYIEDNGAANFIAKNGSDYYYLESGVRYSIPSGLNASWGLGQAKDILTSTLSRYSLSSTSVTPYVRVNGQIYAMLNLTRTWMPSYVVSEIPSNQITMLQKSYFPEVSQGSYILRSSNGADTRLWDVTVDGKVLLSNTASALNVGYISKGIGLTILSPEAIDAIPTSSAQHSLLLQSPGGALKLVSFGEGLGFTNGDSLNAYATVTNTVTKVPQEVFNIFSVQRNATRLIKDDNGKIYWLDNGQKRWILNGALLNSTFAGIPQTYLHSTVTTLIPDGPVIN